MDSSTCLSCTRFRPNYYQRLRFMGGVWFDWENVEVVTKTSTIEDQQDTPPLRFHITSQTVPCAGVGLDPLHHELGVFDVISFEC